MKLKLSWVVWVFSILTLTLYLAVCVGTMLLLWLGGQALFKYLGS